MRTSSCLVVASLLALVPVRALAGSHEGGEVRDHRSGSSSASHSGGVVRDHRSSGGSTARVRDHRGGGGGGDGGDAIAYDDDDDDDTYVDPYAPAGGRVLVDRPGPAFTLEVGGMAGSLRGPALARTGTLSTDSGMYDYGVSGGTPAAGDTGIVGGTVRGTFDAWTHFYVGAELQIGGVTRSPIHLMSGGQNLGIASQGMFGLDGVLGARLREGVFELDGEVAGGVRAISTDIQQLDASSSDPVATEAATTPILEGRLRAALWIAPHLYLAAQVGAGAIDHSDVSFGLAIGTASRAYAEPSVAPGTL